MSRALRLAAIVLLVAAVCCLVLAILPKFRGGSLNTNLVASAFFASMVSSVCFRFAKRNSIPPTPT